MAGLLHFEALAGHLRGGQDYTCDHTYPFSEWQTIFTNANAISCRIPNITDWSSEEEGYQVLQ